MNNPSDEDMGLNPVPDLRGPDCDSARMIPHDPVILAVPPGGALINVTRLADVDEFFAGTCKRCGWRTNGRSRLTAKEFHDFSMWLITPRYMLARDVSRFDLWRAAVAGWLRELAEWIQP